MKDKQIIGRFERIDFPEFDVSGVVAKIDTGAYSGAVFATRIRVEEQGGRQLCFNVLNTGKEFRTTKFRKHWVRSSNGVVVDRYFIDTTVQLNGKTYPISISLADRSSMRYPVLLGRKFLSRHGFIVDVSQDNR